MVMLMLTTRRFQRTLITAGTLVAALLTGCANGLGATGESGDNVVVKPYDTVSPDPSLGDGSVLTIRGARTTADHSLEMLVDGFSCGRPTKVEVNETVDAVKVAVSGALLGDGDCPSDVVPWFVPVELANPLGDRVVTTRQGDQVRVIDCTHNSQHRLCDPPR